MSDGWKRVTEPSIINTSDVFKYGDMEASFDEGDLCITIGGWHEVLLPKKALELAEWIIANQPVDKEDKQ